MTDARLAVIGRATVDYLYVTNSHPIEDTENLVLNQVAVIGGSAGRAAVAAGRLGGDVNLLAMIGSGTHAELLTQQLAEEPVATTWVQEPGNSQHSIVLVSQYWGKKDMQRIRPICAVVFMLCLSAAILFIVLILLLAGYGALSLVGKVVIAMEPAQHAHVDKGNHLSGR